MLRSAVTPFPEPSIISTPESISVLQAVNIRPIQRREIVYKKVIGFITISLNLEISQFSITVGARAALLPEVMAMF
jgi:hypothetical protein